jgi:hypothetical protein
MIEAKAFRTFIRVYSLFKSEHLRANIKLTHKSLIRSVMTSACPDWEFATYTPAPAKQGSLHHLKCSKVHTGPWFSHGFITKLCRQQEEIIQNHQNEHVPSIRQDEDRHRSYKRLKLGGGQAYDHSSD